MCPGQPLGNPLVYLGEKPFFNGIYPSNLQQSDFVDTLYVSDPSWTNHFLTQINLMNLFSIPIVADAIAIVVSWALFAIFCSLAHEGIAQVVAERGRFMKKYLFLQLKDLSNGVNWASLLYLSGPIDLLSRATNKPTNDILPRLFAVTMVDTVGKSQIVQMNKTGFVSQFKDSLLADFEAATKVLKPSDVVSFFQQALSNATIKGTDTAGNKNEAEVYNQLVLNLETWFDEFTQRVNLWYKKKTRLRLFLLGLVLAALVNVDSIQLFQLYDSHPDTRKAVISYYQDNQRSLDSLARRLDSLNRAHTLIPVSNTDTSVHPAPVQAGVQANPQNSAYYLAVADSLKQSLLKATDSAVSLPVGWSHSIFKQIRHESTAEIILKILGLLVTGFAASFGAPFWFDLLKKVYSPRKP
jgi:hypothetical protein